MEWWRLVLVACIGCGRVGFDPGAGVAGDSGGATGDEICNGIDDDGDHDIDEGCPCLSFDLTYPTPLQYGRPSLVWTGSGYLLSVEDADSDFMVLPISLAGVPQAPVRFAVRSNTLLAVGNVFAWSGRMVGMATTQSGFSGLGRFTPGALDIEPIITGGAGMGSARVVWAGDRFALAWFDGTRVWLAEIGEDGSIVTPTLRIDTPVSQFDSIIATPDGYALGVHVTGTPGMLLVRRPGFASTLLPLDLEPVDPNPWLVLAGGAMTIAALELRDSGGDQRLQILSYDGVPLAPGAQLPSPVTGGRLTDAVPVADGTGFRVIGFESGASDHMVSMLRLDGTGAPMGAPTSFTAFTGDSWYGPGAFVAHRRFGVVLTYQDPTLAFRAKVVVRCE